MHVDPKSWRGLLLVALLLAGFALKGLLVAPPHPIAGPFDADQALARLQRVLGDQRPHPVDSQANDAVRDRLIAELRGIGLDPRVQDTENCSGFPKSRVVSCARVRNVIATIPGRAGGRHVLLNAHYDSTPAGPGAGDDGIGVATLLEVGSILKATPLPRPVTLLFNEGEEWGLNGAAAFVRNAPEVRSVDALVNVDARGVNGPALMFETSDPNGAAIAAYASATHRPAANSISTDFAKLIPNTTDAVFFKPRGWTLLNYAIIGNETLYHSPGDTTDALDRASLAHLGSEVLEATRSLAARDSGAQRQPQRQVFTDIGGRLFIHLPLAAAGLILGMLLAATALLARRKGALGAPMLSVLGVVAGGSAAATLAAILAGLVRPGDFWRAFPLIPYLALYATVVVAMLAVLARSARPAEAEQRRAAAWLLILIMGSALSLALPGATIFFLIAPAIALAAMAIRTRSGAVSTVLVWAAALIHFLMIAELLALVEMLLIDGPLWAVAPFAAMAALPIMVELDPLRSRLALILAGTAVIALFAAALVIPRASAQRPLGFSIDYFRDSSAGKANWGVATKQAPLPSGFPGQWQKGVLPYNGRTRWIADAPMLATPAASADLIASVAEGSGRRIRFVLSRGGSDAVAIRFPEEAKVVAIGLAGDPARIPRDAGAGKTMLRCTGRSCDGLIVEALLGTSAPVVAELLSTAWTLPPQGARLVAARPRHAIPQYAPDSTITRSEVKL